MIFSILLEVRWGFTRTSTLGFPRADFGLFRHLTQSLLGDSHEEKRSPGRLNINQAENPKGTGAAIPMCCKTSQLGKISLDEVGAFAGTKGKMEEKAGNSGGLKECCGHPSVLSTGEATL